MIVVVPVFRFLFSYIEIAVPLKLQLENEVLEPR